jgi:3-deoxy-D-manno-octulosonic acid (KDO) 8-phosphate synthase
MWKRVTQRDRFDLHIPFILNRPRQANRSPPESFWASLKEGLQILGCVWRAELGVPVLSDVHR